MHDCGCSEEYGPCEQHGDTLVNREGASLRTGDELTLLLVSDLKDCGVALSEDEAAALARLEQKLEADRSPHSGVAWFSDQGDAEAAQELSQAVEGKADGLMVIHEDGYRIVRPHEDCPLNE
jgi:hypothetical protein